MSRRLFVLALAVAVFALPAPAGAHHSTAMFNLEARLTLNGVLKEIQWTNPHAWIQVTAPDAKGVPVEWSIECGSPNSLARQGWKLSMFKAGQKVSIVGNPKKDGTPAALLVTITLADGTVLGPGAPSTPAPTGH
jgi:hypothetical protein